MSSGVVVHAEPAHPPGDPPEISGRGQANWDAALERWLDRHLNVLVSAVMAAAFAVRVIPAAGTYLNPDEALHHYLIINHNSLLSTYRVSLTNAHPPLIYLLVYYWCFLGRSELMLRFPSVLAGTGLCWMAYKWIATLFGKTAGVIGLVFAAFTPALIAVSAELRAYALLLFCESAALYLIEMALQERSVRKMWCFSIVLYLAILSHYSAVFFVAAAGVYALARMMGSQAPRKLVVAWAGGQAGALGVYAFLYVTHISKLKNLVLTWAMSFDRIYSQTGREHLFRFSRQRTLEIFVFLFENQYVARVVLLLWIAAAAVLVFRLAASRRDVLRVRLAGILLLLPLVAVWSASVAGFYPYVGSRHTVFLAPFLSAALSFILAAIDRQRLWAALLIAFLLMGASNISATALETSISAQDQSRKLMAAAMDHIHRTVPPGGEILTDYQIALMLVYYLCGPELVLPAGTFNLPLSRVKCNGYTIGSFQTWNLDASFFLTNFAKLAQAQSLKPGDRLWLFQSGWEVVLGEQLPQASPKFRCLAPKNFGANISLIPLLVKEDFSPAPAEDCSSGSF